MPVFTEQEIINGCRKKDRIYQEYLYKNWYSMFLKVCARYARDMEDAEQLLNDGFLRIFTHIDTFGGSGSFEGWMRRIMVNTCLDYLKSKYLKTSMRMEINADKVEATAGSISNSGLDKMEFKELVGMMQNLPAVTRTVFNLFVFEGYSHKQIGTLLDISEGTSSWHVHQARKLLQKKFQELNVENRTYATK
jgi:RNA polymerase sigma-70 factor (ECF subfamily)